MAEYLSWVAAAIAVIAMLATLWFAKPAYLQSKQAKQPATGGMIPAELDRLLFKRFWQWLSITGGIVASITVAAWVLLTASFGAVARDVADEQAQEAVQALLSEIDRLKKENETTRTESREALLSAQYRQGQIEQIASSAEDVAAEAESSAESARERAAQADAALKTIRSTAEATEAFSSDLRNITEIRDELAGSVKFQEAVASVALSALDGIVVASIRPCGELGGGWATYEQGRGRVIVGVGSTTDERGESRAFSRDNPLGGAFAHALTLGQMPSHRHATGVHQAQTDPRGIGIVNLPAARQLLSVKNATVNDIGTYGTDAQGGGEPHNNMPPYIALYFCKKEG